MVTGKTIAIIYDKKFPLLETEDSQKSFKKLRNLCWFHDTVQ